MFSSSLTILLFQRQKCIIATKRAPLFVLFYSVTILLLFTIQLLFSFTHLHINFQKKNGHHHPDWIHPGIIVDVKINVDP